MVTTRSMARELAEDRLSVLPEGLLLTQILSKISYRDVIRSSLLSKRWRFLWKNITHLNFCSQDFEKQKDDKIQVIINNALLQPSASLPTWQLQIALDDPKNDIVNNWVSLAAGKQVEQMTLRISDRNKRTITMVELGDSVFECVNLTALKLAFFILPKIPTNFRGFQSLNTCFLYHVEGLDDAKFQRLMELCPNLQQLGLHCCLELRNLNIHASNLRCLDVGFIPLIRSFKVTCPQLTEIKLEQYEMLQGIELLQGVSRAESIKNINLQNYGGPVIQNYGGVNPVIPSITVLNSFTQLEELTMHGQCFQEMISEEVVAVVGMTLPNLKKVHAHIGPVMEGAVTFLGFLLRNNPLTVMMIFLPARCSKIMRNNLLDLLKEFPKSRLSTTTKIWPVGCDEICRTCDLYSELMIWTVP